MNLEIQSSQYIKPKVTVNNGAETIQGRKFFKGGNYVRKYGIQILIPLPYGKRMSLYEIYIHFLLTKNLNKTLF